MAKNNNTLVFNGLMQGMSWDQIKEAKDEIKRHQGEKPPTKKDILTGWIIGKDYMLQQQGEQYRKGGHLAQDGSMLSSPNAADFYNFDNQFKFNTDINSNTTNTDSQYSTEGNNNSSQNNITMGSGLFEGINSTVAPVVGKVANSLTYNDYWGNSSDVNTAAYGDSSADPIVRLLGNISGTGLKRALDEIENRRQGNYLNLNYGDNASLMAQIEAYNKSKLSKIPTLGEPRTKEFFIDTLNSTAQGALHGATLAKGAGGAGAFIGGVLGLMAKGGNGLIETSNRIKLNDAIQDANNDLIRNDQRIAYTVGNSQSLNAFNQLQHMTKNGGHLAQDGGKKKNKYAIEGSLADKYKYTTLGALLGPPAMTYTKTPEEYQEILNNEAQASAILQSALAPITMSPVNNWPTFGYITGIGSPFLFKKINDSFTKKDNEVKEIQKRIGIEYSKGGKLNKAHKFAEGGLLSTYDYGLEEVNAGGSHEENPNEGVVVSYAPDGLPNKVEEGETIHNDYVYSKRLEANEKVLKNNLLDEKYEGKSFADISKKLTEDRKQRPNDPISVRTNEENLNRLQDAQEELKLDNKTREVKKFLGSLNNDQLNALQQEMMDEYEAYAEQQAQQQEAEDQAYQEEQAAQEGMFGKGGHLKQGTYGNSSLSEVRSSISELRPVYDVEGNTVGWKNPDYNSNEKVLNISGYNPNYEGAQIYADNRNWFQRNIASPWNTWWNNLPSPEFSWAARNLTPVGAVDAIINGDTEALLEGALFSGLLGKAKKASKVVDKTDDALRLMQEAQLGGNTTKEVTKEAAKNSSKWLKSLGIGVGAIGLPLAGFYVTDIEKNKDKYDQKAQERGRSIGDTIVGDWQFKGDTVINTKTGEKIYSKGGHINWWGNKLSQSRYEAIKALYDQASYSNPHIPNYSVFGKYLNNLTPEEVEGSTIGYRDIFGRFVPFGGQPQQIVPSYQGVSSGTNTNTDASESERQKPPQGPNKTTTQEFPNYLSYLRYAPILGSLGQVLSDTLGLTNQPDYSNIDMYRRAVDNIGGVNFVPIGGYQQYTPIDREYIANQQLAQAASYNRSLNNVNPIGSYILGIINDAKVRDQIGDMYINAAAQDQKDKLAVAEYNRGIDITNARNSLAAQSENARLRAQRANEYQKIATMRDNERNIAEAARAANYDKFITNVGNLGKEEFAFNQVDSNAALLGYYTDRTGRARYRMPAFIKPDGFEAYKQYLKSHGVDESQIDA